MHMDPEERKRYLADASARNHPLVLDLQKTSSAFYLGVMTKIATASGL